MAEVVLQIQREKEKTKERRQKKKMSLIEKILSAGNSILYKKKKTLCNRFLFNGDFKKKLF